MKASELVKLLQDGIAKYGDGEVVHMPNDASHIVDEREVQYLQHVHITEDTHRFGHRFWLWLKEERSSTDESQ